MLELSGDDCAGYEEWFVKALNEACTGYDDRVLDAFVQHADEDTLSAMIDAC